MFTTALENFDPSSEYRLGFVWGANAMMGAFTLISFCFRRASVKEINEDDGEYSNDESCEESYEEEEELSGSFNEDQQHSNSYELGEIHDYLEENEESRIRDSTSTLHHSRSPSPSSSLRQRERSLTPPPPLNIDDSESFSTYLRGLAQGLHTTSTQEQSTQVCDSPSATRSID